MNTYIRSALFVAPLVFAAMAGAQHVSVNNPPVIYVTSNPTGACAIRTALRYNTSTGDLSGCSGGVWNTISGTRGAVPYCAPASASGTTYTCTPSPALAQYTAGLTLAFVPDVNGSGGATTLNVNSLGAKSVKRADGTTNPLSSDFVAGSFYQLTYDGTVFREGQAASAAFASVSNAGTDVICALHADTITGLTCNNTITDGTTTTAFATTTSIPAGTLTSNVVVPVNLGFGYIGSVTAATVVISIKLGSTVIYTSGTQANNSANTASQLTCGISALGVASNATPLSTTCTIVAGLGQNGRNTLLSTTTKSIAVDTTIAETLSVTVIFGANTAGNALWLYSIAPGGLGATGATGATGGTATASNCSSAASPAACSSAAGGSVVVAAAATTVVVNTSAVTANSQIFVFFDSSLGTKLGVTCNTTEPALYGVSARVAATSFTITSSAPSTNPACFSYWIGN